MKRWTGKTMEPGNYQSLNEILHSRIRLAIVSVLVTVEEIDFTALRNRVGATDGNMNAHLKKLEEAGYINVKKKFADRKPVTSYRLSARGRESFKKYVAALEGFIRHDAE
jgi:DNA-binding MarR family transcriptional regulator